MNTQPCTVQVYSWSQFPTAAHKYNVLPIYTPLFCWAVFFSANHCLAHKKSAGQRRKVLGREETPLGRAEKNAWQSKKKTLDREENVTQRRQMVSREEKSSSERKNSSKRRSIITGEYCTCGSAYINSPKLYCHWGTRTDIINKLYIFTAKVWGILKHGAF